MCIRDRVFGINMGVWAFDRYIRKADFAYINAVSYTHLMDVETRLAKAFRSRTELRDPHANYNKMSMEMCIRDRFHASSTVGREARPQALLCFNTANVVSSNSSIRSTAALISSRLL